VAIIKILSREIIFLIITATVIFSSILLAGCDVKHAPTSTDEKEKIAQGIDKSLMCPICPSETIDQSQVELAKQMRMIVREKLAKGETRDEILQFFAGKYGLGVLAEPPRNGFNLLIWIIPPVVLLLAILILSITVRSMKQDRFVDTEEKLLLTRDKLEPYMTSVDREIYRLTQSGVSDAEIHDLNSSESEAK